MLPIRFTYLYKHGDNHQKIYLSVLRQTTHHFTGEKMLYVREEGEDGWIDEGWYSRRAILKKLETRVEENE